MECVLLAGGLESGSVTTSLSWLAGFRLPNGMELGVGPNLSVHSTGDVRSPIGATTSMVMAAGATVAVDEVRLPANVAVAFAEGGPRVTALVGWIIRGL